MLPRIVGFNKNGIAIASGCSVETNQLVIFTRVMQLPGNNPDFIEFNVNVNGKTEDQIRQEIANL
jgi:hypothetical protein